MFTSLAPDAGETVILIYEGRPIRVRSGLTVAAALLEAGVTQFRDTPVSSSARGPFCMMGVCFDCLMVIDGMANSQACMTEVKDGMHITRQSGAAEIPETKDIAVEQPS